MPSSALPSFGLSGIQGRLWANWQAFPRLQAPWRKKAHRTGTVKSGSVLCPVPFPDPCSVPCSVPEEDLLLLTFSFVSIFGLSVEFAGDSSSSSDASSVVLFPHEMRDGRSSQEFPSVVDTDSMVSLFTEVRVRNMLTRTSTVSVMCLSLIDLASDVALVPFAASLMHLFMSGVTFSPISSRNSSRAAMVLVLRVSGPPEHEANVV